MGYCVRIYQNLSHVRTQPILTYFQHQDNIFEDSLTEDEAETAEAESDDDSSDVAADREVAFYLGNGGAGDGPGLVEE